MPRLNEILNVAKNIKTPSVTINIRKADDEEEASDLISQVREGLTCVDIVGLREGCVLHCVVQCFPALHFPLLSALPA